jgi:hypothetical protein
MRTALLPVSIFKELKQVLQASMDGFEENGPKKGGLLELDKNVVTTLIYLIDFHPDATVRTTYKTVLNYITDENPVRSSSASAVKPTNKQPSRPYIPLNDVDRWAYVLDIIADYGAYCMELKAKKEENEQKNSSDT